MTERRIVSPAIIFEGKTYTGKNHYDIERDIIRERAKVGGHHCDGYVLRVLIETSKKGFVWDDGRLTMSL